jgi:hypothetical protein
MKENLMNSDEQNLDRLLERYSRACPDVAPSAGFMPGLWQRIDARKGFSFKLASYARILAMSAASLCLAAGLFEISAYGPAKQLAANHFVDILDDDDDSEALIYGTTSAVTPDQPAADSLGGTE